MQQFPETQSREIFSAYLEKVPPPLVNLPERGKSAIAPRHDQEGHNSQRDEPQGPSDDDDVDTDETDVEDDLFDKLQEVFWESYYREWGWLGICRLTDGWY